MIIYFDMKIIFSKFACPIKNYRNYIIVLI